MLLQYVEEYTEKGQSIYPILCSIITLNVHLHHPCMFQTYIKSLTLLFIFVYKWMRKVVDLKMVFCVSFKFINKMFV